MSHSSVETKKKRSKDNSNLPKNSRADRTIRLPFDEKNYSKLVHEPASYREQLDKFIGQYPELFPKSLSSGGAYTLYDIRYSKRLKMYYRRIEVEGKKYTIHAAFVLPYCVAKTDSVSYPLLLMLYGVPYWLITQGFGRQDDFWYRLFRHFGHYSLVGTTAGRLGEVPEHLAADEKITWSGGEQIEICTTSAQDCLWGAAPVIGSGAVNLGAAYGVFKQEAQALQPDYKAKSVNTDGWPSTRKAWRNLFCGIRLILCFLHGYIDLRKSTKKLDLGQELRTKVWEVYEATNKIDFEAKMEDLHQWTKENISHEPTLKTVAKLHKRRKDYAVSYDEPQGYRTSNMVDRPMRRMDRFLFMNQYFHGHFSSTTLLIRAFALCYNFMPFGTRHHYNHKDSKASRAANYNNFEYHGDWLCNLLTATSLNRSRAVNKPNPQIS